MEPIRVTWRIIAPGRAKAVEQRIVRVTYAVEDAPEEPPPRAEPAEFHIIANSPEHARTVTAGLLRLLRHDSRCRVLKEDCGESRKD